MGVDFITTCAISFEKSWDRNLTELAQPSLFAQTIALEKSTYLAIPKEGCALEHGKWYEVVILGSETVLLKGLDPVGVYRNLPQSQIEMIRSNSGGTALGYVNRILEHSGMAEVTIT